MDFESLKNQVSNLTLYDVKAGVRKVQNGKRHFYVGMEGVWLTVEAVMNLTEMESKVDAVLGHKSCSSDFHPQVREATNGDPWGASATLMQEIARGTHN